MFLVVLLGVGLFGRVQEVSALFAHKWSAPAGREDITAGIWLAEQFQEETTILYDAYAYIPGKFQQALPATPAMTYPVITHFEPDVLVIRDARYSRYGSLADSKRVSINKGDFFDIHYFYPYVRDGRLPDYRLLRAFDRTFVYERGLPRNHGFSFASCYDMLQNGQMLNEVSARERMGDAAIQAGDWHEAVRQYDIGLSSFPNIVTLQYKLGRAYALIGEGEKSRAIFNSVLEKRKEVTAEVRANILWDMGQFYFAGALYDLALEFLKASLELQEDRADAHFDIAACHLALGDPILGVRRYADAVQRFGAVGAVSSATVKLETLRDRGIEVRVVDQILAQYFGGFDDKR